MEHIKTIYFKRHLYKFEDIWTDQKYALRNINDLNGFLCCLCCIIPFGVCKACIMCTMHLIILIPFILITSIILFPYQLITIYISTLSTILLGPKIKFVLFLTIPLLYAIFIIFYLIFAILSCIYFSFYAAFKVTLSANYYVLAGYIDPITILFANISIYLSNNTKKFKNYCKDIKNCKISEGNEVWDISFNAWCNMLMSLIMTTFAVLCIMSFVFVEVVLYLIPFSIHLMINLYVFKFLKHFFKTMIIKQPCLALICCPFILFPLLLIPIFSVLYLSLYVWLYSAFFNKAIIMEAYIDNSLDCNCLQQCSYIINTICLYNNYLFQYSFQSCWKCHCCYKQNVEDDGYDLSKQKTKKRENAADAEYNPHGIKLRQLSAVFWQTKNNGDLVRFGKRNNGEQKGQKRKEESERESETDRRKQMNIELWTVPNHGKKSNGKQLKSGNNKKGKHGRNKKKEFRQSNLKTKLKRVDSDSLRGKLNKKDKYEHIDMMRVDEEQVTDSEELNVLIPHETNKQIGFSYPRGI